MQRSTEKKDSWYNFSQSTGFESREEILRLFYKTVTISIKEYADKKEKLVGSVIARAVYVDSDEEKKLYRAGDKILLHDIDELLHSGVDEIEIIDFKDNDSLHSNIFSIVLKWKILSM